MSFCPVKWQRLASKFEPTSSKCRDHERSWEKTVKKELTTYIYRNGAIKTR